MLRNFDRTGNRINKVRESPFVKENLWLVLSILILWSTTGPDGLLASEAQYVYDDLGRLVGVVDSYEGRVGDGLPDTATARNPLVYLAAMVGAPVGYRGAEDRQNSKDGEHLLHEGHGWSPSSQNAQRYKPITQIVPRAIKGQDAWPVTQGLTRVIRATPFARS